ncbi:hypothetical protein IWX47DRAFT_568307 [Phyllosticta citricarpa]
MHSFMHVGHVETLLLIRLSPLKWLTYIRQACCCSCVGGCRWRSRQAGSIVLSPCTVGALLLLHVCKALMSDGPSRDRRAGDATLIRSERGNQDKSRSVRRFGDAAWCGARVQRCRKLNRTPLHPSIHPSIPDDNMIPAAMSVRSLARSLVSSSKVTGWKTYVRERPCFAQMRPDAAKATSANNHAKHAPQSVSPQPGEKAKGERGRAVAASSRVPCAAREIDRTSPCVRS